MEGPAPPPEGTCRSPQLIFHGALSLALELLLLVSLIFRLKHIL